MTEVRGNKGAGSSGNTVAKETNQDISDRSQQKNQKDLGERFIDYVVETREWAIVRRCA